jgi:hypothetical protein
MIINIHCLGSSVKLFVWLEVYDYNGNISGYVEKMHGWMTQTGHSCYPLYVTEWGTYLSHYDSISFDMGIVQNLIRASQPGNDYVYGSHIFSLYDCSGTLPGRGLNNFQGLVDASVNCTPAYYALRLGVRGLQGGQPTCHVLFEIRS